MKEKFIKSTIILLIGGLITKFLGMFIKITMSRLIGTEGLGLYMLILPTFSLFIGISQFGLPIALSKLVAEDTKNNKKLLFSIIPLSLIINIALIIIIIIISPFLATKLLHNKDTYYALLAIAIVIPFTSISSITRSYFFGKQKMLPHVTSNITEDIIRLIIMIIGIPYFLPKGISYTVCFIVLSNVISEISSILVLFLFIPKNFKIQKNDLIPSKTYIKESLSIGIPNTTGRFIGSVGYFLEPIILTSVLLHTGYSSQFITREYGILSGYVMPLLLLPSFFTMAISQALLPVVSKEYARNNIYSVKKKIKQGIMFSLLIGIPTTILFMLIPEIFLKLIYHTNEGTTYMKILAPICLFQYIQAPLSSSLDAMGKSKDVLVSSTLGMLTRTIFLLLFSLFKIGIYGLIIAIAVNVILVTFYSLKQVKNALS